MLPYMLPTNLRRTLKGLTTITAIAAFTAIGCSSSDESPENPTGGGPTNEDGESELSDLDSLIDGVPAKGDLPEEGKADAVYPAQYSEPMQWQSSMKAQGSRGVCSIFAAVGLMEHLYIKANAFDEEPDFSEEFLQWSAKVEGGHFTRSEGSNSRSNLSTIHRFGIVEEPFWPYLGRRWNESDDPECTSDDNLPTKCYTHGDPPAEAMAAKRWHLPAGRWIRTSRDSIKAFIHGKALGLLVGGTFYYQSWNHRKSTLPTNQDYWRKGYVTYPNEKDQQVSLEKRAGHAFQLVGWDDDLEVQRRDADGNMMVDASGAPDMEKGFFVFKNSWGTGSFGSENPFGDGYGYISMEYVEDFLSSYASDLPDVEPRQEICNDEIDNDGDEDIDCADSDCSADPSCSGGNTVTHSSSESQAIPDNDGAGIRTSIVVPDTGTIDALSVTVDITHSYRGDLVVKLVRDGGGEAILHDQEGGGQDDLKKTFSVAEFNGEDVAGTWHLVVSDNARIDTGNINGWTLEATLGSGGSSSTVYESTGSVQIPDNDSGGASSEISVTDTGAISALKVNVDITHTYKGDLTIKLQRVGAPGEVVLQQADSSSGAFVPRSYNVGDYDTQDSAGTWRLTVIDEASADVGTLNKWSVEITR